MAQRLFASVERFLEGNLGHGHRLFLSENQAPPIGVVRPGGISQCQDTKNQARQKSTKINFLGPETARWGGGLPREGVVAEKLVPSLESLQCSKSLCKKSSCAFFVP